MSIRIDGRRRRLDLRPPTDHRQRKQSPRSGQRQNDLPLPHYVALIASVVIAAIRAHHSLLARMENGGHSTKYLHRRHIDAAIDECRNVRTGLFHVVIDGARQLVNDQTAVVDGLLLGGFRAHDGDVGLALLGGVEVEQLLQWEIRADVSV